SRALTRAFSEEALQTAKKHETAQHPLPSGKHRSSLFSFHLSGVRMVIVKNASDMDVEDGFLHCLSLWK
ncbi:mCG1031049, isoform CRA_b, partial [Mus musculus]